MADGYCKEAENVDMYKSGDRNDRFYPNLDIITISTAHGSFYSPPVDVYS